MTPSDLPVVGEQWLPCYRIIPSRFPPIDLFERVADRADFPALYELQALTNPRLREEMGELELGAPEDRMYGPGTMPIMAAFTHRNPAGSRFSDGSYGVYYAARGQMTAIYETIHHQEQFLRDSQEDPIELDMRVYLSDLNGDFHDLRGVPMNEPVYDPADYDASRVLGRQLRMLNAWGLLYRSVRHSAGECVAVFRPPVLSPCRQGQHLTYVWNGERVEDVFEKREILHL